MRQIKLSGKYGTGKTVIVDNNLYDYLNQWKWHLGTDGYPARMMRLNKGFKRVFLHRVVANTPEDKYTDHKNDNKLDARESNLRVCSSSENQVNKRSLKNEFKGVSWCKRAKKWQVYIWIDGKNKNLGSFDDKKEAAKVYNKTVLKYRPEFGRLNII